MPRIADRAFEGRMRAGSWHFELARNKASLDSLSLHVERYVCALKIAKKHRVLDARPHKKKKKKKKESVRYYASQSCPACAMSLIAMRGLESARIKKITTIKWTRCRFEQRMPHLNPARQYLGRIPACYNDIRCAKWASRLRGVWPR